MLAAVSAQHALQPGTTTLNRRIELTSFPATTWCYSFLLRFALAKSAFCICICKQGAAGSSPATSTNYIFFNEIASMFSQLTNCYSGRGLGVRITSRPPLLLYLSYDLCCLFDCRLPGISRSIRSNNRLGKPDHGDNQMEEKDEDAPSRHGIKSRINS